jgi:hypothetical protein
MKSLLYQPLFICVLSVFFFSCEKEEDITLNQNMKLFMEFKNKNITSEVGGVNNFMSVISASQFNSKSLNLAGYNSKEGYGDPTCLECDSSQNWSYFTCATVTETKNADGTTTTIYDYGTGCDEYGSLMKGKITYIWKNEGSTYESKVIYDHFYSYGTEINGYSENSFTSDGNSYFEYSNSGASEGGAAGGVVGGDSISYPEIAFNWSGTSIAKEVLTITDDEGKKYNYDSENSTKWDNSTYTVLTGVYNYYSNTEDYEYHYLVSKPLVTNYECSLSWVPVSGVEKTTNIKSGKRDELIINYGNGECDNYALVTNNGKTTKIDLSEWFNMSNDSTVSNTNVVKGKIRRK